MSEAGEPYIPTEGRLDSPHLPGEEEEKRKREEEAVGGGAGAKGPYLLFFFFGGGYNKSASHVHVKTPPLTPRSF